MSRSVTQTWRRVWFGLSVVFLCVALSWTAAAQPVYLVDTGPGGSSSGLSLTRNQYLAGQFSVELGAEIDALEGWIIFPTISGDLPVDAVLYGDADGVPDTSDEIYSQLFLVPGGIPIAPDWYGVDTPDLALNAGTYWLAFEVPTEDFGSGAMPPTPAQELDLYAVASGGGAWVANETANLGIRVLPEPAAGSMLLAGAASLLVLQRWRGTRRRS